MFDWCQAWRWRSLLNAACALGIAAPLEGAPADDPRQRARELANLGADAYARGSFARAHELFRKAYEHLPAPTIALFEARALVRMKRLLEARSGYERAAKTPLSANDPKVFHDAVEDARAELAALERRIPRYRVEVESQSGAVLAVYVDGRPLPLRSFGAWTRADPGVHEVRAGRQSDGTSVARFTLREGERRVIHVDRETTPGPERTWGFVALGVGATGLGLGISAGLVALDAHRDARRLCPNDECVRGSAGAAERERFQGFRTLSSVGYAIGAVGAGAGAVLLLMSSGSSTPRVELSAELGRAKLKGTF